ncbi:MAG: XrtA/PEP-CTERM system TPR-repeat protein PrsT [Methylococcaceae bacterium]
MQHKYALKICCLALLPIAICSTNFVYAAEENINASQYYEKAVVEFRNNDMKAAIINLKNAIQQNQKYLAAHVLLGRAYLSEKDFAIAEYEFSLSKELGADKSVIVLPQAQLYLYEMKYSQLLQEIDAEQYSVSLQPELHVYRGHAHFYLNQFNDALKEYEIAARLNPQLVSSLLGKANALLRLNNVKEAKSSIDKAIQLEPKNAEVWFVQASIEHAQGNLQQAIKNYDKSLEITPNHLEARLARAGLFTALNKDEQALLDFDYLRENYPFEPRAAYLQAVVLERNNRAEESKKALEAAADILLQVNPIFIEQNPQILMLSGLVNYSLKRFDVASNFFKKYIKQFPEQLEAYKLLGDILLTNGEANKVVELLEPVEQYATHDNQFLLLLGTAYSDIGKYEKANITLEKAASIDTLDHKTNTELGMNQLAVGDSKLAVKQLEMATKNKPDNTKAGINLVVLYIKRHEGEKALPIAKAMSDRFPDNLTLLNLYGTTQVAVKQMKQARATFEKVISFNPDFITSHLNLSKLDVAEKKYDAAKQRLLTLNKKFPINASILLELAQVEQAAGDVEKSVKWLEDALKIDEKSLPVVLAIIETKFKAKKYSEALNTALNSEKYFKHNVQFLVALVNCHIATGQKDTAKSLLKEMAENEVGYDAKKLYEIAGQQTALADYAGAIKSLQKATKSNSAYLPAKIALAELQLNHGQQIYALNIAQELLDGQPNKAIGHRLMGDIASHDKNFSQAVTHYQTALEKEKNTDLLMRLYVALRQTNNAPKASSLLEQWVKAHPNDTIPILALADEYLQQKKWIKAQKYYEPLLKNNPNQSLLLNNLAYIYFVTANSNALEYAEKAFKLTPNQASSNDTLGWILVNKNQPERGLEYLRTAHTLSAQNSEIRYHLGVALYKLNRIDEAKIELEAALLEQQAFNGIDDARSLLDKIKK